MPPGGAPPGYAPPQQAQQWVLDVPPDATWEPIETSDTLEKDGYYCAKIVGEKIRQSDNGGKIDVIMTLEIQDPDAAGKKIARFLPDPRLTKGDTWFVWRGLMRSMTGVVDQARAGFRYTPGQFHGQYVFVKTEAYGDEKGNMRTGVGAWVTRGEWEEAQKAGGTKFRWPAQIAQRSVSAGAGALPPGLPAAFAGAPGALPGAPTNPGGMPMMPQPGGFPPPQPQTGFPPPAAVATPQPTGAPMQQPPNPGFPPQAPPAFAFPQQAAAPPAPAAAPPAFAFPPPANGAMMTPQPPPTAAGLAAGFPPNGQPPQQ